MARSHVNADAFRVDIGSLDLFVVLVVAPEPGHGEWCDAVGEGCVDDQIEVPRPRDGRWLVRFSLPSAADQALAASAP